MFEDFYCIFNDFELFIHCSIDILCPNNNQLLLIVSLQIDNINNESAGIRARSKKCIGHLCTIQPLTN